MTPGKHTHTLQVWAALPLASPCWLGRLQVASSQERGRRQYLFTWDHKHQPSSCPKDSLSQRAPTRCAKTGLLSCYGSASIPPESERVSSHYWNLQFLCVWFLWSICHLPLGMRKKAAPSAFLPNKKGREIKHLLSPPYDSYRFQACASIGRVEH